MSATSPIPAASIADPALRRYLERFLRRRVPASDVDDLAQSVLCAACASSSVPGDRIELRRWITGVARHQIAAYFARIGRERLGDVPEVEAHAPPHEASSLLRWVEREVGSSSDDRVLETLDWMARESDGEPLESIAAEASLPAPRVRQRVSRLRRWMKARWAAQVAFLALVAIAAWELGIHSHDRAPRIVDRFPHPAPTIAPFAPPSIDRAAVLRERAFAACTANEFATCLHALDEAAALDPAGEASAPVVEARRRAKEALTPKPPPVLHSSTPAFTPTSTGASSH